MDAMAPAAATANLRYLATVALIRHPIQLHSALQIVACQAERVDTCVAEHFTYVPQCTVGCSPAAEPVSVVPDSDG